MNKTKIYVTGSGASVLASRLSGMVPDTIIVDDLYDKPDYTQLEKRVVARSQNNYDKHHPLCSNGYNFGKHKRGATSQQQSEYLNDAQAKRARKNAKRAKERM